MHNLWRSLKTFLINGIVITIPLVVTLVVLAFVLDIILGLLSPIVAGVGYLWPNEPPKSVLQLATVASLLGFFVFVGFVAEHTPGTRFSRILHRAMETIPGIGTIYSSVRRASTVFVDDDTQQFKDVRLVDFPHQNAHMLGFLTAETPDVIHDSVGEEGMITVMIPLGPNPTTNGFVLHTAAENVHDIDVTVEEAFRSIATLGVASDGMDET